MDMLSAPTLLSWAPLAVLVLGPVAFAAGMYFLVRAMSGKTR